MYPHLYSYNQHSSPQQRKHEHHLPNGQRPRVPPDHPLSQMQASSRPVQDGATSFPFINQETGNNNQQLQLLQEKSISPRILAHQYRMSFDESIRANVDIDSMTPGQTIPTMKAHGSVDIVRNGQARQPPPPQQQRQQQQQQQQQQRKFSNFKSKPSASSMPSLSHMPLPSRHESVLEHTYQNPMFNSPLDSAFDNGATDFINSPIVPISDLSTSLPPLSTAILDSPSSVKGTMNDRHTAHHAAWGPTDRLDEGQMLQANLTEGLTDVPLNPYGCDMPGCMASFPLSSELFYHMKNVHPVLFGVEKPFRCAMPNCAKRYKNLNGLQYHLREAKGSTAHLVLSTPTEERRPERVKIKKTYKCKVAGCKKSYMTSNGLRYHNAHVHNQQSQPTSSDHNIFPGAFS